MVLLPAKWSMELTTKEALEEDIDLTELTSRIKINRTGDTYFQFKLWCNGQLVFSLDSEPDAEPNIFMVLMGNEGNKMPWECLLDDANRIE